MELRHYRPLGLRRKIHEHIPAENDVYGVRVGYRGEIGIIGKITRTESNHPAHLWVYFEGRGTAAAEIPFPQPYWGLTKRPGPVESPLRRLQGLGVNIRSPNHYIPVRAIG
jgi:hypothetical protein